MAGGRGPSTGPTSSLDGGEGWPRCPHPAQVVARPQLRNRAHRDTQRGRVSRSCAPLTPRGTVPARPSIPPAGAAKSEGTSHRAGKLFREGPSLAPNSLLRFCRGGSELQPWAGPRPGSRGEGQRGQQQAGPRSVGRACCRPAGRPGGRSVHVLVPAQVGRFRELYHRTRHLLLEDNDLGRRPVCLGAGAGAHSEGAGQNFRPPLPTKGPRRNTMIQGGQGREGVPGKVLPPG